jgi:hypothetical protein
MMQAGESSAALAEVKKMLSKTEGDVAREKEARVESESKWRARLEELDRSALEAAKGEQELKNMV